MRAPRFTIGKAFVFPILFAITFSALFSHGRDAAMTSSSIENPLVKRIFFDYGYFVWPTVAILYYFVFLVLAGLKVLFGMRRFASGNAFAAAAASVPFAAFSYFLVFHEPRHTEIARAVIDCFGKPMLAASAVSFVAAFFFAAFALVAKQSQEESKP